MQNKTILKTLCTYILNIRTDFILQEAAKNKVTTSGPRKSPRTTKEQAKGEQAKEEQAKGWVVE